MDADRATRLLSRKANRHLRDGLKSNDAVLLAFTDYGLELPLSGKDEQGRPEWVGWNQDGELIHIYYRGIEEAG